MSAPNPITEAEFVDITPARLPVVKVGRLPTTITHTRINAATLPTVISAAQQAIARCTDLPQLLEYRDKAEGLAAAVRIMKNVGPDMVRKANEMMADAWRKGGELLSQYSKSPPTNPSGHRNGLSPRGVITKELKLNEHEAHSMLRVAAASKTKVYAAMKHTQSLYRVADSMPPINPRITGRNKTYTDNVRSIVGVGSVGLTAAFGALKRIDFSNFKQLAPDERKVVKAKITEIMELLDEMDRLCK